VLLYRENSVEAVPTMIGIAEVATKIPGGPWT
jgi:hypothetical protein